jgi:hypothetical protein
MAKAKEEINDTHELRKILTQALFDRRKGVIDHDVAADIANLSGKIISTARLDLEYMKQTGKRAVDGQPQPVLRLSR